MNSPQEGSDLAGLSAFGFRIFEQRSHIAIFALVGCIDNFLSLLAWQPTFVSERANKSHNDVLRGGDFC